MVASARELLCGHETAGALGTGDPFQILADDFLQSFDGGSVTAYSLPDKGKSYESR